jgi:hypothetical protein
VNFTREPIVETIISAKEGYKLSIKSSKTVGQEEYLVDAVEVVSFSGALFYRCSEKPKAFFLPIHDYEVGEIREAKLAIRSPVAEKSIKIGGGKEASRQQKVEPEEKQVDNMVISEEATTPKEIESQPQATADSQKRVKKQKFRRKRGFDENAREAVQREVAAAPEGTPLLTAQVPAESVFSHLLKPPETLISASIHKYKKMEEDALLAAEVTKDSSVPQDVQEAENLDFFSEPPKQYEKLEEDIVETATLIFTPADIDKAQE